MFQIIEEKCRLCLGCLQTCPVRAVELRDGTINVVPGRCVDCGKCYEACPHGAIETRDETGVLEGFLKARRKVILSLDPACRALLPEGVTLEHLAAAVQAKGVWDVADASEAGAAVASEYARLLREGSKDCLILSHCPVVRNLVEQYAPELIGCLAPVASPMIAHGRMLKRDFTSAAVVYVTPCGARAREAEDVRHSTEINAVLTLPQLMGWLDMEPEALRALEPEPLLSEEGGIGVLTALPGGMQECIRHFLPDHDFSVITADGVERCKGVLELLRQQMQGHCVVELSGCEGGCMGGCAGNLPMAQRYEARFRLEQQLRDTGREPYFDLHGIAMANPAIARPSEQPRPDEAELQEMLYHMGVGNKRQQLNCGACGYDTCRARAEAILSHRETVSLCRRVVQETRRDIFRSLYESLPMAAILVDDTQRVVGLNQEACSLFSVKPEQEKYIFELMDPGDFQYVLDTGLPIKARRMDIPEILMRVEADLVPLKELGMVLGLFRDITEEEEAEAEAQQSRLQSVEMAQKVIEKQMTVAQQIAFLLGETTAETKVTLNQIKARILGEEDEP